MKKKLTAIVASIALATSSLSFNFTANANISSEVNRWFASQDYANITNPQSVETQSGRMYTLGGVQTRNQVKQGFNFVNIQPPSVSAGCSGIDLYAGGFGFVNEEQFVQSLKAIGQNAKSLAFMMAIKIASSQLEDEIAKIQEWANKFNQFQIDSCSAASELLEIGTRQVGFTEGCVQLRMQRYGEERYQAQVACTTGGQSDDVMNKPNDPEMNKVVFTQGNLAWVVMMQDNYFRSNPELAEIMMNIMGTIVVDSTVKKGQQPQPKVTYALPSALGRGYTTEKFKGLFDYFYLGKESDQQLTYFACTVRTSNSTDCLDLKEVNKKPTHEGMKSKIDKVLLSVSNKVRSGSDLTNEEKGVIASSSLPILRYISASTASSNFLNNNQTANINIADEFSQIIAYDLVINNIKGLIERANINAHNQQSGLSESSDFQKYKEQLEGVLSEITKLERENADRAETRIKMQERIQKYEKEILPKISPHYVDAANFQ